MFRIDNVTSADALPTPGAVGVKPNAFFTPGDPSGGIPATIVTADWANAMQEELAYVIEQAGLTLSKTSRVQLLQAIKLINQGNSSIYAASTTAANTYTATLAPVPAAYTTGGIVFIKFTNHNTGAATINLNSLGAKSIKKLDGSALLSGDISDSMIAALAYDGTNFQLLNPSNANLPSVIDVQNNAKKYILDTGSANTYVATLTHPLLSYVAGNEVLLKIATLNTGASTVNVNGLGAKSIKLLNGNALSGGELIVGMIAHLVYDGTNYQLVNPPNVVRTVKSQIFTVGSGTYTPSSGMVYCTVEMVGGGGAGGGSALTGASSAAIAGGGGAGAFVKKTYTAALLGATAAYVVGAAGTAGAAGNNAGGNGADSTFTPAGAGVVLTAAKGLGGAGSAAATTYSVAPGGLGGSGTNGDINIQGSQGGTGQTLVGGPTSLGYGAAAVYFGAQIQPVVNAAAPAGIAYGSGGAGGAFSNAAAGAGGAGSPGLLVITEYCNQ